MITKPKIAFFIVLGLYLIAPLAWIYSFLDKLPAFIFLSMPLLGLLFSLVRWKSTAKIIFRVLLFFILIINSITIYHALFLDHYSSVRNYIMDQFPIDLLIHGGIIGFIIALIVLIILKIKIGYIYKAETAIIGIMVFLLSAITLFNT